MRLPISHRVMLVHALGSTTTTGGAPAHQEEIHDTDPALRSVDGHRRRTRDDARLPPRHRPARLRRVPAARHRGRSRGARRLLPALPRPRPAARCPGGGRHADVAGEPRLGRTPRLRRDPARRRQPASGRVRARARHKRTRRSGGACRRRGDRPTRRRLRGRRDDVGVRGGCVPRPAGTCLRRGRRGDDDRRHDDVRRRGDRRGPSCRRRWACPW